MLTSRQCCQVLKFQILRKISKLQIRSLKKAGIKSKFFNILIIEKYFQINRLHYFEVKRYKYQTVKNHGVQDDNVISRTEYVFLIKVHNLLMTMVLWKFYFFILQT